MSKCNRVTIERSIDNSLLQYIKSESGELSQWKMSQRWSCTLAAEKSHRLDNRSNSSTSTNRLIHVHSSEASNRYLQFGFPCFKRTKQTLNCIRSCFLRMGNVGGDESCSTRSRPFSSNIRMKYSIKQLRRRQFEGRTDVFFRFLDQIALSHPYQYFFSLKYLSALVPRFLR